MHASLPESSWSPHRRAAAILLPLIAAFSLAAGADSADTLPAQTPWGARTQEFQSRLTITNSPTKGSPIQVTAELRNTSDKPVTLTHIRVWLMVAQGPERVFYTSPSPGPEKKTLAGGEALTLSFDAALLDAFPYSPKLVIKNGVPATPPGDAQPLPAAVGKLTDFLPAGHAKAKAFIAVSRAGMLMETPDTFVVPSNAFTVEVRERSLSTLDPTAQRATLEELTALFRGSALSGKVGHDRALAIGKGALPHLIESLNDPHLSDPGRMWLTATLVEIGDPRAVDPLIALLNKGGPPAYVVAYVGPKMKAPALTAAIQQAAKSPKDPMLTAWALRGLGTAGEATDPSLLETMLTHSDATGRMEAAEILAAHPSPQALPLLVKLIRDDAPSVRIHAAQAAAAKGRKEPLILQALDGMARRPDTESQAAAQAALEHLKAQ